MVAMGRFSLALQSFYLIEAPKRYPKGVYKLSRLAQLSQFP